MTDRKELQALAAKHPRPPGPAETPSENVGVGGFPLKKPRLTFFALREANLARLPLFKNAQGRPAHPVDGSLPHGFDWSLTDWMTAVAGETGELANVVKKVRRGDMTMNEARAKLAQEAADIVIYLDLFAYRAGFRLDLAVQDTWNNKSRELGLPVRLNHAGAVAMPAISGKPDNGFDPNGG